MNLVALNGPPYAGKTALAEELERRGYLLLPFNDILKDITVQMLEPYVPDLSVAEIKLLKGKYRPFLQELGTLIGFDDDPMFMNIALKPWWEAGMPKAVLDNVRFEGQYEVLQPYHFKLVHLDAPTEVRKARAKALGVTAREFTKANKHAAEQQLLSRYDLHLSSVSLTAVELADMVEAARDE